MILARLATNEMQKTRQDRGRSFLFLFFFLLSTSEVIQILHSFTKHHCRYVAGDAALSHSDGL